MDTRIPEGAHIAFIGEDNALDAGSLSIGDEGRVVQATGMGSYVLWATGALEGQITLEPNIDIVAIASAEEDVDLDATITTLAAKDVYAKAGSVGILNILNKEGHLAFFEEVARDAISLISSSIRNDASFKSITEQLDFQEGENLIQLATNTLIRDAFNEGE